jgi:outer membrane protein, heavy metal efflux system
VRQTITARALEVAADAESAWFEVAAAQQMIAVREAIARAASTSAGLAQRVFEAGNISRLDLSLEKAAAAETSLALMDSRSVLRSARTTLNRVMGLGSEEDNWRTPQSLPGLPDADPAVEDLFALADRSRPDLAAARTEVELQAEALGLTRKFRLLGEIDVELSTERETDRSRITGPSLELQLPIFDQGTGRVSRAQAALAQSEARLQMLEVDISATVRSEAGQVAAARERVSHYRDVLIPLREQIVVLMQQQVNFMLDDPARLILARQEEYEAYGGYLEAVRDYWLARTALARAVGAALPGDAAGTTAPIDAARLLVPDDASDPVHPGAGHGNMRHDGMDHEGMEHPGSAMPSRDEQQHQHGEH